MHILVCKDFHSPRPMEMYSSLLLCNMQFFFCSHALKYKFHDGNYKKCISCDFQQHQHRTEEKTTLHWMLHSHLLLWVEHVPIYGFMMINVYLYLCMLLLLLLYYEKYNLYFTVMTLRFTSVYTERIYLRVNIVLIIPEYAPYVERVFRNHQNLLSKLKLVYVF